MFQGGLKRLGVCAVGDGEIVVFFTFFPIAQNSVKNAKHVGGLIEVVLELQCPFRGLNGALIVAQRKLRGGYIVVGIGVFRIQP